MCLDGIFPFLLLPISLVVSWATIIRVDPRTEQATHLDNDRFQMMIPVDENEKLYLEKPKSLWFLASYLFLFSLGNAKGRGTRKEVEEEEHVERRRESIGLNNESFGMHEASEPIRLLLTRYNYYYPTCNLCTCRFFFLSPSASALSYAPAAGRIPWRWPPDHHSRPKLLLALTWPLHRARHILPLGIWWRPPSWLSFSPAAFLFRLLSFQRLVII